MTKNEIIETAFRVWGRDFYRKPSLSSLAKELKVSKPALYRHFLSKDALNKAMQEHFFDDFAASIRPGLEKASQLEDIDKALLSILQAIGGYFGKNCFALIFSLMNIYDRNLDNQTAADLIIARNTDIYIIRKVLEKKYNLHPILLQFVFSTLSFYMGNFHKNNDSMVNPPTEKQINDTITTICGVIKQGLGFS